MTDFRDTQDGRVGEWMHTRSGRRFFPQDPRAEDIFIGDIAQGLAGEGRYANQCERRLSVAEHSVVMARYAYITCDWPANAAMAMLLHDAAEAYYKDMPRAVKVLMGPEYKAASAKCERIIFEKYGCWGAYVAYKHHIKHLDRCIVRAEKIAIGVTAQTWAADNYPSIFHPVDIQCWGILEAREAFLHLYEELCVEMKSEYAG